MTARPRVAVVGPGAVGCYFGAKLAQAGSAVTLLGRPGPPSPHLQAIAEGGVWIQHVDSRENVALAVAGDVDEISNAELVLFCVKTPDTEQAACRIAPHLAPQTLVVSLQNGVDNAERMRAVGVEALSAVVFVGAAIETPGVVIHRGRGDLIVGGAGRDEDARRFASWCEAADIPCPVATDIRRELWLKLTLNSMANASSALTHATYGQLKAFEPTWRVALDVAREAVALAAAEGVALELDFVLESARTVIDSVSRATASTEQDLVRGRPTEIDALNGYIARRGEALGIATPVNHALFALVKLIDELAAGSGSGDRAAPAARSQGPVA